MAHNPEQLFGDYASDFLPQFTKTPWEGLQELGHSAVKAPGCYDTHCENYDPESVMQAVQGADTTIVCLGTGQDVESEGHDRQYLDLPGKQLQLLQDAVEFGE